MTPSVYRRIWMVLLGCVIALAALPVFACVDDLLTITPASIKLPLGDPGQAFTTKFTVKQWPLSEGGCRYNPVNSSSVPWIHLVEPSLFGLDASQTQDVTIKGVYPSMASFQGPIYLYNVDSGAVQKITIYGTTRPPLGIHDEVKIDTGPASFLIGATITYTAKFQDFEPPQSHITSVWTWKLKLLHADGEYVYIQQNTTGQFSTLWSTTLSVALPTDLQWIRNDTQDIVGEVSVLARDNEGFLHSDRREIALRYPPDKPLLVVRPRTTSSVGLAFSAGGADEYEIHYDTKAGPPYTGTGAAEGSSPIHVRGQTQFTLTNLNLSQHQYRFSVRALNSQGASVFAEEISVGAERIPLLSHKALALLIGSLAALGLVAMRSK